VYFAPNFTFMSCLSCGFKFFFFSFFLSWFYFFVPFFNDSLLTKLLCQDIFAGLEEG